MGFHYTEPKLLGKAKKRSTENQKLLDMLDRFIDENESEPIEVLVRFWKDQENAITYKELREMVENQEVDNGALMDWSKDYSILVKEKLVPVLKQAVKEGGKTIAALHELDNFSFEVTDANITKWIDEKSTRLITNLVEEQRDAIQAIIYRGYSDEIAPEKLARMIRPCIGLTKPQTTAVYNHRIKVIESLKKDHPRMKQQTIERKAEDSARKYSERLHRYRAKTIVNTELAEAYSAGAHASVIQAQEKGYMGKVEKVWVTARQSNVCKFCETVEGVKKAMDEPFDLGKCGMVQYPPAHPRCRCVLKYVEVKEEQGEKSS